MLVHDVINLLYIFVLDRLFLLFFYYFKKLPEVKSFHLANCFYFFIAVPTPEYIWGYRLLVLR